MAFLNGMVAWFGGLVGVEGLTIQWILGTKVSHKNSLCININFIYCEGQMFIPLAWLMGVPHDDLEKVEKNNNL